MKKSDVLLSLSVEECDEILYRLKVEKVRLQVSIESLDMKDIGSIYLKERYENHMKYCDSIIDKINAAIS